MSGSNIYEELVGIALFLAALWVGGFTFRNLKLSSIVGEILVGVVLGPNLLNIVPLFTGDHCDVNGTTARRLYDDRQDMLRLEIESEHDFSFLTLVSRHIVRSLSSESSETTNVWVVLGQFGVTLLIMESGLHVDFPTLRKVGAPAFFVAVIGTIAPLGLGIAFSAILGFNAWPDGVAIGATLAPTSVGIALKLLQEANVLNSVFGQTIVTAAFTDDIFSLVTLTVLLQVANDELTVWGISRPFVFSFLFMVATFLNAIYIMPRTIPRMCSVIARNLGQDARDKTHLAVMFLVLGLYTYVGKLIGSHLLGAFVAGVSFVSVPRTKQIWEREMDAINAWLLRIFFGATVGFAVPVKELLTVEAFWKGLIIAIVPGILGKVVSGFAIKGKRLVIGWAMVGRGEFAFLVAETLRSTVVSSIGKKFLGDEGFGAAVWALVIATVVAPIAFGFVLASQQKRDGVLETKDSKDFGIASIQSKDFIRRALSGVPGPHHAVSKMFFGEYDDTPRSDWRITVGTREQAGLLRDVINLFTEFEVTVKQFINEGDENADLFSFLVSIPDESIHSSARVDSGTIRRNRENRDFDEDRPRGRTGGSSLIMDDFFRYDVDILVANLKRRIEDLSNLDATVIIERIEKHELAHIPEDQPESDVESDVNVNLDADESL